MTAGIVLWCWAVVRTNSDQQSCATKFSKSIYIATSEFGRTIYLEMTYKYAVFQFFSYSDELWFSVILSTTSFLWKRCCKLFSMGTYWQLLFSFPWSTNAVGSTTLRFSLLRRYVLKQPCSPIAWSKGWETEGCGGYLMFPGYIFNNVYKEWPALNQ